MTEPYTLFISYPTKHIALAAQVCHLLKRRNRSVECYIDHRHGTAGPLRPGLQNRIRESRAFVLFATDLTRDQTDQYGNNWQEEEVSGWHEQHGLKGATRFVPVLLDRKDLPTWAPDWVRQQRRVQASTSTSRWELGVSEEILRLLDLSSQSFDDLPAELHARYEKEIISHYSEESGVAASLIEKGYPSHWPDVTKQNLNNTGMQNPLNPGRFGGHRTDDVAIAVDARVPRSRHGRHVPSTPPLTFPEAGPRSRVLFRNATYPKAGILVSGGIAPGINAVISAIVERHKAYADANPRTKMDVVGYVEGFRALLPGPRTPIEFDGHVETPINQAGSILQTSRVDELLNDDGRNLEEIVADLCRSDLRILYVIGGEGSMRAAHAIHTIMSQIRPDRVLSIVGIPKTMDNDILWVWQSFGFMSAVEKARDIIIQLRAEVVSNPRVGVVQLFGSASGYVVSHAAFGSNLCDLALIPEMAFTMKDVCQYIEERLRKRRDKGEPPAALVAMAETAVPTDFGEYVDEEYVGLSKREKEELDAFGARGRVTGQTPDELRSGALKIVTRVLRQYIRQKMGGNMGAQGAVPQVEAYTDPADIDRYWHDYRVLVNEPRHIVRSMAPSVTDVAFCVRLGTMAVDMAMAGYTDCMVSQWLTEYVVVPLKLVVLGRKLVPLDGIFWKTVVSKTGQSEFPSLAGSP